MQFSLTDADRTLVFDAEKCRKEKIKILDQMCIPLDRDERIQLSKLTTARQMDAFVVSMINKHWR